MAKLWAWTAPKRVHRNGGRTIRFEGWTNYEPGRVPALWLRIAALASDIDTGWLTALQEYGPLLDTFDGVPRDERHERAPWRETIERLAEISGLWREGEAGIWALPESPVELTRAYRRLQTELQRVAGAIENGIRLALRGLDLVPEPGTLEAYLWLAAAESVRERHRFRKCERCDGWFAIRRTDALFCSAVCRNWRPAPASEATADAAG
jgi:hypothetical protein